PTAAQASTRVVSSIPPPTSSVTPLPAVTNATSFPVSWSGSDAPGGTGIAGYTISVSVDGGPYSAWLSNTTATSATYSGQDGHSYGFYSVATGKLGNVQPTPTSVQATTLVDTTAP